MDRRKADHTKPTSVRDAKEGCVENPISGGDIGIADTAEAQQRCMICAKFQSGHRCDGSDAYKQYLFDAAEGDGDLARCS
jgi:hypothetical protein